MLILDEKKIRKGKAVGLPYIGSKKKISKKIVEIIKQNFDIEGKAVYDIFGGGGAITSELLINGIPVVHNELDKSVHDMFKTSLSLTREEIKGVIISRSEFETIKKKEEKTAIDDLKILCNSFGNNRRGYLYAKEFSDLKHNLAVEIIEKHDCFSGYKQTETYKKAAKPYFEGKPESNRVLERLQQLQQLERLQQLQQQVRLQHSVFRNESYEVFSGVEGQVLYLGPPYEDANGYQVNGGEFDHEKLYDWAYEMSKKNIVLISSYAISDERFGQVFEFSTARSTLAGGSKANSSKTERLFMAKV